MSTTVNFESLITWCPQAFVFADLEGKILFSNPAADKLYGYDEKELLGKDVDIFNSHLTHNTEEIVEAIKNTGSWMGEIIQKRKDNSTFHAELSVNLVFEGGNPTGLCSYSRDISDKKEAEKSILDQRALLAASSKLSAVGEMAAGIAHEMNNPLAIISAKAQLLRKMNEKGKLGPEKISLEVDDILHTCNRISLIIKGLKSISRDSTKDAKEPVTLHSVVMDALHLCQQRFKINNINFNIDLGPSPETIVLVRPGQISQVLLNLLNNSFDAVKESKEKEISLTIHEDDKKVFLEVENNGETIEEDLRDKIMEPFFTTKEAGKGTGLGLSISKKIMEGHGGELLLKDAPKTCFVVSLNKEPI
ncbi:MAG: PAS domain S-box-containing protein [Bacteriovoracaceae bacterium]